MSDLLDADGLAQAEAIRTGEVSVRELVDASIARIEAENPALNAVIHPRSHAPFRRADGSPR